MTDTNARGRYMPQGARLPEGACTHRMDHGDVPSIDGYSVSALGWLLTIAARRLVDAYRRRTREANLPPAAFGPEIVPAVEDEVLRDTVGDEMGQSARALWVSSPGCSFRTASSPSPQDGRRRVSRTVRW